MNSEDSKKFLLKWSKEHRLRKKAETLLDNALRNHLETVKYLTDRVNELEEQSFRNNVLRMFALKAGVSQEELWEIIMAWEKAGKPKV